MLRVKDIQRGPFMALSVEFEGTLLKLWEAKHLIHCSKMIKGKRLKKKN